MKIKRVLSMTLSVLLAANFVVGAVPSDMLEIKIKAVETENDNAAVNEPAEVIDITNQTEGSEESNEGLEESNEESADIVADLEGECGNGTSWSFTASNGLLTYYKR